MDGQDATNMNLISPDNEHDHLKYVDVDQSLSLETDNTPSIHPESPWTVDMEIKLTTQGEMDHFSSRNRIIFATGQHVSGCFGGSMTVGIDTAKGNPQKTCYTVYP